MLTGLLGSFLVDSSSLRDRVELCLCLKRLSTISSFKFEDSFSYFLVLLSFVEVLVFGKRGRKLRITKVSPELVGSSAHLPGR